MTGAAPLQELSSVLGVAEVAPGCLYAPSEKILEVAERLKDPSGPDFDYLDMITAADYPDHFEVVYRLLSLKRNEFLTLKTRVGRENPRVPSLTSLYKGADFQEREIFDLFGIGFEGHPCLRRIMLWEGFEGHPLRKDYHGA